MVTQIREASQSNWAGLGRVQLESWPTMFPDAGVHADAYLAQFSFEERADGWREFLSELLAHRCVYVAVNDSGVLKTSLLKPIAFAY